MAWLPAVQALKSHLADQYSDLTLTWDGEEFNPPSGNAWVLGRFISGNVDIRGVGTPGQTLYLQDGLLHLLIHTPKHAGMEPAYKIADRIGAILLQQTIPAPAMPDYVRTDTPRVDDDVATDLKGTFAVTLLSTPFTFYHYR
jgi:hypothetical protein